MDRAVRERPLGDVIALSAGLQFGPLDSIALEESIKLSRFAPATVVVVVLDLAGFGLADDRVLPPGKLNGEARHAVHEDLMLAGDWLRQTQPRAGGGDRDRIANLGLNVDNVTQQPTFRGSGEPSGAAEEGYSAAIMDSDAKSNQI